MIHMRKLSEFWHVLRIRRYTRALQSAGYVVLPEDEEGWVTSFYWDDMTNQLAIKVSPKSVLVRNGRQDQRVELTRAGQLLEHAMRQASRS